MLSKWFGSKSENAEPVIDCVVDPSHRIYAIGDVHGRVDLINRMLQMVARDIAAQTDDRKPMIVFLGDYIDRGDNSKDVLDVLIGVKDDLPSDSLHYLMGNHEAAILSFLQDPANKAEWLRFGGLQTLLSYGVSPPKSNPEAADLVAVADSLRAAMGQQHINFLASLEGKFRSGDVLFVHAGIDPYVDLVVQSDEATLWGRSDFIEVGGVEGLRVIHGHYDNLEPIVTPRRICVDTGAYYSGRLTAVRLDDEESLIVADVLDID